MKRSIFVTKIEGLWRLFLCQKLCKILRLYIITEYPKSGGSWFGDMLAESLQISFPRNRFPKLESCVMHGHYLYSPGLKNVFVVLRDGRDVMVSFYYYSYFKNERFNERLVERTKRHLPFEDYDNIRENLPKFIEYKFTSRSFPRFTWSEFVNSWSEKNHAAFVKYENLMTDPIQELSISIKRICGLDIERERLQEVIENYSFEKLAKRNPGTGNKHSFLRKGIVGDWKNCFSQEAKQVFVRYAGEELIKAGYERDDNWIDK